MIIIIVLVKSISECCKANREMIKEGRENEKEDDDEMGEGRGWLRKLVVGDF